MINKLKVFMLTALLSFTGCNLQKEGPNHIDGNIVTPIITEIDRPTPTPKVTSVKIPVKFISQYPEFPTGCESVSTVMLLKYLGYDITPGKFIDNYLPRVNSYDDYYTGNNYEKDLVFQHYFVGNPRKDSGTACFPNVIKKAVDAYFKEIGETNLSCYDLTGTEFEDLYIEIDEGNPVVLWITMYLRQEPKQYTLYGKQCFYSRHTVLMTGYDEEKDIIYINDPMEGSVEYDKQKVLNAYNKMGQRAAVIK